MDRARSGLDLAPTGALWYISGTSSNTNSVATMGTPFTNDPPTLADMELMRAKYNELLLAARRCSLACLRGGVDVLVGLISWSPGLLIWNASETRSPKKDHQKAAQPP